MLAGLQFNTAKFVSHVSLNCHHFRIVGSHRRAFQEIAQTSVDHFPHRYHIIDLLLELGKGFRLGIGGVGMILRTSNAGAIHA